MTPPDMPGGETVIRNLQDDLKNKLADEVGDYRGYIDRYELTADVEKISRSELPFSRPRRYFWINKLFVRDEGARSRVGYQASVWLTPMRPAAAAIIDRQPPGGDTRTSNDSRLHPRRSRFLHLFLKAARPSGRPSGLQIQLHRLRDQKSTTGTVQTCTTALHSVSQATFESSRMDPSIAQSRAVLCDQWNDGGPEFGREPESLFDLDEDVPISRTRAMRYDAGRYGESRTSGYSREGRGCVECVADGAA